MAKKKKKIKYNPFQQLVVDKLNKLGTSVGSMRNSLAKASIHGIPGESESCPLANYLRDEFGIYEVSVGSEIAVDGVTLPIPKHADYFIARFDERKFPELIEPNYRESDEDEAVKKLAKQRKKK